MSGSARSADQIAADIAQTRNRLAGTIDQLVYRAKPKTIVSRQLAATKASFYDDQGSLDLKKVATIVGVGVGIVGAIVAIRKIVG